MGYDSASTVAGFNEQLDYHIVNSSLSVQTLRIAYKASLRHSQLSESTYSESNLLIPLLQCLASKLHHDIHPNTGTGEILASANTNFESEE